jgi:hypothetical protein
MYNNAADSCGLHNEEVIGKTNVKTFTPGAGARYGDDLTTGQEERSPAAHRTMSRTRR